MRNLRPKGGKTRPFARLNDAKVLARTHRHQGLGAFRGAHGSAAFPEAARLLRCGSVIGFLPAALISRRLRSVGSSVAAPRAAPVSAEALPVSPAALALPPQRTAFAAAPEKGFNMAPKFAASDLT
jgi:hypothetical protein